MNPMLINRPVRLCAHRGFGAILPDNTLPALGAALALGADEIEFDLWASTDGVIVSCHEIDLSRCSDGHGRIYEHSFDELRALDFGSVRSPELVGLTIPTFEEILQLFAGRITLAVHVKDPDNVSPLPERTVCEIARLLKKFGGGTPALDAYFICGNNALLAQLFEAAPEIPRCVIHGNDPMEDLIEKSRRFAASRISLFPPYFKYYDGDYVRRTIHAAHENGMTCNIDCDDPDLARRYRDWGADTLVTNRLMVIRRALSE